MEEMLIIMLAIAGIWLLMHLSRGSRNGEGAPSAQSVETETSEISSAESEIAVSSSYESDISEEISEEVVIEEKSFIGPKTDEKDFFESRLIEESSAETLIGEEIFIGPDINEKVSSELKIIENSSVESCIKGENFIETVTAETDLFEIKTIEDTFIKFEALEEVLKGPKTYGVNFAKLENEEINLKQSVILKTESAKTEFSEETSATLETSEVDSTKALLLKPDDPGTNILESQSSELNLLESQSPELEILESNTSFRIRLRYGYEDEKEDYVPDSGITSEDCWIPFGSSQILNGITITSGCIYVGRGLAAGNGFSVEPALVDPSLKVNSHNADIHGIELGYWPYYHMIGARSRAGYLQFLATRRDDPKAPIGFVFLYYYGLERRLIIDAESSGVTPKERNGLISEVERLLSVYSHNNSFRGYARNLLDFMLAIKHDLELPSKAPDFSEYSRNIPLYLQIELGIFSFKQYPIPAKWAYAWIMQNSQFQFQKRRVFERCAKELKELFISLYRQRYGKGIVVKANKTLINAEYYPASPGIGLISKNLILPKITILKGPNKKLAALVNVCLEQLDAYSRFIGRYPERKDSIEALLLLPPDIASSRKSEDIKNLELSLKERLCEHDFYRVPFSELSLADHSLNTSKPNAKSMKGLAGLLEYAGIGVEPDIRYTTFVPDVEGNCIIFSVKEESIFPLSENFKHATLVIRLAGIILYGQADTLNDRHRAIIGEFIESFEDIRPLEAQHLKAFFFWGIGREASLAGMRKQLGGMTHEAKNELERKLIKLACVDGVVGSYELKKLRSISSLLGRDPETLYSKIHSALAEPTLVRSLSGVSKGFRIPAPLEEPGAAPTGRAPLDAKIISQKRQETEHISDVLNSIFSEQALSGENVIISSTYIKDAEPVKGEVLNGRDDNISSSTLGKLDASHLSLLKAVALQADGLSRGEADAKAAELKLLLSGALDHY